MAKKKASTGAATEAGHASPPISHDRIRRYRDDPWAFLCDVIQDSTRQPFGKVMTEFQAARFRDLVPDLLAVAQGTKPPNGGQHWWEATKGASKDTDLAIAMIWLLAFAQRPLLVQVGAADREQAAELWKAAKKWLFRNPWLHGRITLLRREICCKATGATLEIIAADDAGSHGASPDVLIVNELHVVKSREFAENLVDNADKVADGLRVIATNAGFKNTWQYRWREIARESPAWRFHQLTGPSPWTAVRKLDEARRRNSHSRYMRLWHGVWSSGTGDAIDGDEVQACVTLVAPPPIESDWFYLAGLDLGVKHDHAALVVLGARPGGSYAKLCYVQSWTPSAGTINLMRVEADVLAAHERYRFAWLGYDPYQAALMAQRLTARGVPCAEVPFTGKSLDLMARELLSVFRSRRIALYPEESLIADLLRLRIVERSYGHKLESVADESGHADRATAFAIALPVALEVLQAEPEELAEAAAGLSLPQVVRA